MTRQKQINKMLSKISSSYVPYDTYGRVFIISWFHIIFVVCMITPFSDWIIPFCVSLRDVEAYRVSVHG